MTDRRTTGMALAALMLAAACLPIAMFPGPSRAAGGAPPLASTAFHQVSVFQGDDPGTSAREPDGLVQVIDRSLWHVPWDATELYTVVPEGARSVSIDHVEALSHGGGAVFMPGRYSATASPADPPETGAVSGGSHEGLWYWRFPESADRSRNVTLEPVPATGSAAFDANITEAAAWNVTGGTLRPATGRPNATMTSPVVLECHDVVSVNLTWTGDLRGWEAGFEASADNGTTWAPLANGTESPMAGTGGLLRWRLSMGGVPDGQGAPHVDSLRLVVRQVPLAEDLWLQSEWTVEGGDGAVEVPLEFPLDAEGAGLVLLVYADEGADVRVEGTEVTASTVEDLPGKRVYRHMQGPYSQSISISIDVGSEGGLSALAATALIVALIAVAGAVGYVAIARRRRAAGGTAGGPEGGEGDEGDEAAGGAAEDEGEGGEAGPPLADLTVEQLELRKRRLLEAIRRVDAERADGLIGEDEHASMRAGYKGRAADVMRELDSRKRG